MIIYELKQVLSSDDEVCQAMVDVGLCLLGLHFEERGQDEELGSLISQTGPDARQTMLECNVLQT